MGTAVVAILESHGLPAASIEMTSKSIEIEGESYNLDKSLKISINKINESTTSITIDEDGAIEQSDSNNYLCNSKSRLSLHGIEVPTTLFPESWRMKKNQVKLDLPFPILIVIDICGNMDLDLNSSRTQIIMSEKWQKLEEILAFNESNLPGSSSICCNAIRQASTSPARTKMPFSSSRTFSGKAPIRDASTGTPAAAASWITTGEFSYQSEGTANRSVSAKTRPTSALGTEENTHGD